MFSSLETAPSGVTTISGLPNATEEENGVHRNTMDNARPSIEQDTSQVMSHPEVSAWPGG